MHALQVRQIQPGQKIRVMVVDDSVVIRRLVCHAIEEDRTLEVVAVAANGAIALSRVPQANPDVITLDIEMPEMNGLEMLRRLRQQYPGIRVVMFSTMTERGADTTLEALALGAEDYVTKASNAGSLDVSLNSLRRELIPKIRQFFRFAAASDKPPAVVQPATCRPAQIGRRGPPVQAVAIGVSTGGPVALSSIVPQFPSDFPVPIFVVQHMPPLFTRFLAERLNSLSPLTVKEAVAGEKAEAGRIYLAPGDFHMSVSRGLRGMELVLDQSPPLNSCRPAVDVLFASLADACNGGVVAAVLTGMGQDGTRGAQRLKGSGSYVVAQDEASSVVWGMPGAVVQAGVADEVLPIEQVVPAILRRI